VAVVGHCSNASLVTDSVQLINSTNENKTEEGNKPTLSKERAAHTVAKNPVLGGVCV
jgi:hypothetical protein